MTTVPVERRVVSALQALVRIATVSDRDPSRAALINMGIAGLGSGALVAALPAAAAAPKHAFSDAPTESAAH